MAEKTTDAAAKTNGYDKEKVEGYVKRCENLDTQKVELHMAYMKECRDLAADKKELLDEAKKVAGIPKKDLKHVLKVRAARRKLKTIEADVEPENKDSVDMLWTALEQMEMAV